ncbi:MAG: zinc ribbon domain-containing protein [Nitrospira sp.]|nr:zinc ribbon domain-containing protein [Nitrospira sp.]
MPIYEYACRTCKKRMSQLVLNYRHAPLPLCSHCGSHNVDRIMSRFAAPKSEEARLEALASSANLDSLDEGDPESMARFMQTMKKEMGDDFGDEMDDMSSMLDDEAMADETGADDSTESIDSD